MHNHSEIFDEKVARAYDDNNSRMAPIHSNLRYLIKAIFSDLPIDARIISVGSGTGTEIIQLAEAYPGFSFVAVEPSAPMLEVCRDRLGQLGLLDRCELVHGYVVDVSAAASFDAALCLLVGHHVSKDDRQGLIAGIASRLKPKGYFINAEISLDFSASHDQEIVEKWKSVVRLMGAPAEKVQGVNKMLQEQLDVLSPPAVEDLLVANGFRMPVQFFQSLAIRAWYAQR